MLHSLHFKVEIPNLQRTLKIYQKSIVKSISDAGIFDMEMFLRADGMIRFFILEKPHRLCRSKADFSSTRLRLDLT